MTVDAYAAHGFHNGFQLAFKTFRGDIILQKDKFVAAVSVVECFKMVHIEDDRGIFHIGDTPFSGVGVHKDGLDVLAGMTEGQGIEERHLGQSVICLTDAYFVPHGQGAQQGNEQDDHKAHEVFRQ